MSDINLTNYQNYLNTTSSSTAASIDAMKNKDLSKASDEELMDACKQFESYFVEQMFKQMMKTVPEDPLDQGSNSMLVDYYKDNLVKEYASAATDKEDLGLAKMLYEQMKRNIGITPEEADARAAETSAEAAAASGAVTAVDDKQTD